MSINDGKMEIASFDKFVEENRGKIPFYHDEHEKIRSQFPYRIVVEVCYATNDFATRWCWQQFGPYDCKVCREHHSEYPACPKVLAIEIYKIKKSYTDENGNIREYDFHTRDPGKHGHEGKWTSIWLGKTGYDYGFNELCFKHKEDMNKFVEAIPFFNLGENYNN